VTALWLVFAGIGVSVVMSDLGGVISARRQGRNSSLGSWIILPPVLVALGLISLLGGGDSWIFKPALGWCLLAAGVALSATATAFVRRAWRADDRIGGTDFYRPRRRESE
jgi:hypothetical protein